MSKVTVPAEDTQEFTLTFSFENGVGVEMTLEYPTGQALAAINAIRQAGESQYILGLMDALQDDPGVRNALDDLGIGFDDEEDDW